VNAVVLLRQLFVVTRRVAWDPVTRRVAWDPAVVSSTCEEVAPIAALRGTESGRGEPDSGTTRS